MNSDAHLHSPAAERNQGPLLVQLQRLLPALPALPAPPALLASPALGQMLEIASGTGQHAAHFARSLPGWQWQPSDPVAASRVSIAAWCAGAASVQPPLALDVLALPWPVAAAHFDAVFCANMLHIAPWPTCQALMQGAQRCLKPGGLLLIYGPFAEKDVPTAASNLAFDADLRARDSSWGLRELPRVVAVAQAHGLQMQEKISMPANNLLLVFRSAT